MNGTNPGECVTIVSDVDESAGGIWPIMHLAPATLESIAPERRDNLLPAVLGMTIHLKDEPGFRAYALSGDRHITLTRGLAECLWCASYAYYVFRVEIESHIRSHDGTSRRIEIDSNDNPGIKSAMGALKAAMTAACAGSELSWDGLPLPAKPTVVSRDSSLVAKAGEMALAALGFVMHHELAHVRLGHQGGGGDAQWTLDQEKDADSAAVKWILDEVPAGAVAAAAKRTWGIVVATTFMTAVKLGQLATGLPPAPVEDQTHPQPYDRLDKALRHEAIQRNDIIRTTMTSLACGALVPHITIAGLHLDDGPYDDWNHLYDRCMDVLSFALVR